ncbi:hypothetical protein BCR35DRAFT_18447 [Leucosporidium creatinivorum]|uniref:N-acetyltransferase domain-containing protein n=1 Tax=Leucosporidium creatinivorum TaxID=106004 RepID=A0A1Y2D0K8_9BASI|nr:hypothetical protein BCR35DRAFT_18447 [Leucosporidium creatinivorum]
MGPLPPLYRFDDSPAATERHLALITRTLLEDERVTWGKDRTAEVIARQVQRSFRSVCLVKDAVGGEELAGWARVISDGEGFAYLCDVFILPAHVKQGLATALVQEAVENTSGPGRSTPFKWCLYTSNCHDLYRKATKFVDTKDFGWAMTRWPSSSPSPSALSPHVPLPPGYRLDSTREAKNLYNDAIIDGLLHTPGVYWGKQRPREMIRRQIERCEGVVVLKRNEEDGKEELAGWARVVTDGEGFGYLCDVFVLPSHGKLGLSKALIREAVENTGGLGNSSNWKWWLWTSDAHSLYRTVLGFEQPPAEGAREMERFAPNA